MKPQKITVRKAALKDVPVLLSLFREFQRQHEEAVCKKNPAMKLYLAMKADAPKSFGKFVKKNILSSNAEVLIAEVGGKPAGYDLVYIKNRNIPIFKIEKFGYISDMFVRKKYRGLGISSMLKDEAFRWFRKKGITHISLLVASDNGIVRKVYRKWGFMDCFTEMRRRV
jgi:ribosomal protein S18 acetylase RimI-like enzyme